MNFKFFLVPAIVVLCLSCGGEETLMGLEINDVRSILSNSEPDGFSELKYNLADAVRLVRRHPGGAYFIAQALIERGDFFTAKNLLEAEVKYGRGYFADLALGEMLEQELRRGNHAAVIYGSAHAFRGTPADLFEYSRVYMHRFEALLQSGNAGQAHREMMRLVGKYPQIFAGPDLPHGLLYYRARIAAEVSTKNHGNTGIYEAIFPYVYVSSAKSGHGEIRRILESSTMPESDKKERLMSLLRGKESTFAGRGSAALSFFEEALSSLTDELFIFQSRRIDEGLFYDIFTAALGSREYDRGLRLLSTLEDDLNGAKGWNELEARLLELQGILLYSSGDFISAAIMFEEAFHRWNSHLESMLLNSSDWDVISTPAQKRELLLWRWIRALQSYEAPVERELMQAYAWVRSPEFFGDVSDEYLGKIFRLRHWDEIHIFLRAAGMNIPQSRRLLGLLALAELSNRNLLRAPVADIPDSTESGDAMGFLSRILLGLSLDEFSAHQFSASQIESLYPQSRRVPAAAYPGASLAVVEKEKGSDANGILESYLFWGKYSAAASYIYSREPGYFPPAQLIASGVLQAYSDGDWNGGLRILETDINRRLLFGNGVGELIAAAGGERKLLELLYPRPYGEAVRREAETNGISPQLMFALFREESRFDPEAQSHAGAIGLGQIMPETAVDIASRMRMDVYNLTSFQDSIAMSSYYFRYLRDRFGSNIEALAAYNGGQGRVDSWLRDIAAIYRDFPAYMFLLYIPFKETRAYVYRVIESQAVYELLYGNVAGIGNELYLPVQARR